MKNLILYGSQNLSNKKCGVENISNFRGNINTIQKIRNARFAGSTVVEKKVEDKSIVLSGVIRATEDLTFEEVLNEYSKALAKEDRYLRVSTNYHVFTDLEDSTGWQVQGDSTVLDFDEEVFQYADGSIKFNTETSGANGYCGIYTETGTEMDLSVYGNSGAFEAWVYLHQSTGVSSIELKVGSSSANYYSDTVNTQYDGTPLEVGWNYVSFLIQKMDITGTIDPYSMGEYLSIKINYDSLMIDRDSFRVGGILWQEEARTRNFKAFVEDFRVDMEHFDVDRAGFYLNLIAYEGVAESTGDYVILGSSEQTAATYTDEVDLEGTYTPLPKFTVNISAATNVSQVTLTNITTGDKVDVTRTYAAGERLVIDTKKKDVSVNGISVDYDDVLPRFILGENDVQVSIASTSLETIDELVQDANLTGEV
jgi:hypothetical protein